MRLFIGIVGPPSKAFARGHTPASRRKGRVIRESLRPTVVMGARSWVAPASASTGRLTRRRVLARATLVWLAWVAIALLPVLTVQTAPAYGDAQWQYFSGASDCSQRTDPINVVFVGTSDSGIIDGHWRLHLWTWGYMGQWPWTEKPLYGQNEHLVCHATARTRADGSPLSHDRYHARMFEFGWATEPDGIGGGWHVHVGAHREVYGWRSNATLGFLPGICGHAVAPNGFNEGKWRVDKGFLDGGHRRLKVANWGNTYPALQCNGRSVQGDGYLSYLSAGH